MFSQQIDPDAIIPGWLEPTGTAWCSWPFRLDQYRYMNNLVKKLRDQKYHISKDLINVALDSL